MKAYKVFDSNFKCKNFQYEIGKTYRLEDKKGNLINPILCEKGFHACEKVNHCFNYYQFDVKNKIAEVELSGEILGIGEEKQCANIITIICELTWEEMLKLANTGLGNSGHSNSGHSNSGDWNSGHRNSGDRNSGDSNSGHRNSGDWNSGHRNSGHRNSGDWNSGHRNSGDWNLGDWNSGHRNSGDWNSGDWNSGNWNSCNKETGYFNSLESEFVRVFNKECERKLWEEIEKPYFISNLILTEWISFYSMSDDEKVKYPKAYVCDGYLKTYSYKEAWENVYKKSSEEDIELLKKLPNFDAKVFEEITGIKIV